MKRALLPCALLIFLLLTSIPLIAYAHSGKTDSNGGHTDRDTGEYHYHHGYEAHDHYDMDGDGIVDCPYEFDDQTDHSNRNNSGVDSHISNSIKTDTQKDDGNSTKKSLMDIISVMLEYLLGAIGIWFFSSYFLFYIFGFIFGSDQGCSIATITGALIALAVYICTIITKLS